MSHGRDTSPKAYGVVGAFQTPEALLEAAEKVKAEGYTKMDAYSPIPVEGILDVIGGRDDRLGWIVAGAGATGFLAGTFLQVWTSTVAYAHNVGGKPLISAPMFFPVSYESTILFAAGAATFGMIALNGLPKPHQPVFNAEAMVRASQDRFVLCVEATDPKYDEPKIEALLQSLGAEQVESVRTSEGY